MDGTADRSPNEIGLVPGVTVRESDLTFTFSRSGGPGGQAVNKVSTRATLHIAVSAIRGLSEPARARLRSLAGRRLTQADEIVMHAWSERSQLLNKRACIARLKTLVTDATMILKPRKKKRVTKAMKKRRRDAKQQHSERKQRRKWSGD